jgi:thymidylate synthase ThyX
MGLEQIKVELVSFWGGDKNAAESAWASSLDQAKLNTKSEQDITRVVTGLVHLHHDTPKERLWLEFFITCPIFIERQFDKYRMTVQYQNFELTYLEAPMGRDNITQNELSGRYRTIPDRPYRTPEDVSDILSRGAEHIPLGYAGGYAFAECVNEFLEEQHKFYQAALEDLRDAEKAGNITNQEYKRAREVLRGVLGTSYLTDMRIIMNMNAFEHIVNQRLAKDAQLESRVVASLMINEILKNNVCPVMLSNMIKVNGWDILQKDLENAIINTYVTKK